MLVAQIQDNYALGLTQRPMPALPPKGARVRLLGCGVCGSDLEKFLRKKALPGSVLGHEIVGIIEALDTAHPPGWAVGDYVVSAHHVPCLQCHYCLNDSQSMCRQFKSTNLDPGGFAQYITLTEAHLRHTAFKVPAHISPQQASCVEPLACVLRAVRRGGLQANGSVAVIGLGFIGMLAAQVYQNDDYVVYGVDMDRNRIHQAREHGFIQDGFHPDEAQERMADTLQQSTPLGRVDVVFLTAVNTDSIELGLQLVRDGGTLVVFASGPPHTRVYPDQLYYREINLITSYSPSLCDLQAAAHLIFEQKLKVAPLVSHTVSLQDIEQAFELYRSGQALKVFVCTEEVLP